MELANEYALQIGIFIVVLLAIALTWENTP